MTTREKCELLIGLYERYDGTPVAYADLTEALDAHGEDVVRECLRLMDKVEAMGACLEASVPKRLIRDLIDMHHVWIEEPPPGNPLPTNPESATTSEAGDE